MAKQQIDAVSFEHFCVCCTLMQLVDCASDKTCIAVAIDCRADLPKCLPKFVAHCVDQRELISRVQQ